jgi:hypothetical protein
VDFWSLSITLNEIPIYIALQTLLGVANLVQLFALTGILARDPNAKIKAARQS